MLVPGSQLGSEVLLKLERYTRVCYKSENNFNPKYESNLIKYAIKRGHESVIEHEKITGLFIVDRGISHEIVRHRIASYSQESTRYCNYGKEKFGKEITVIEPFFLLDRPDAYLLWEQSCKVAEANYLSLLNANCTPQEARSVLPNSLKTELVVTFNIREWRHFFKLRCSAESHPQMRQVTIPLLKLFTQKLPDLFEDIPFDINFPSKHFAEVEMTNDFFSLLEENGDRS